METYLPDGTPRPIARLKDHQAAWMSKYGRRHDGEEAPWMPPAEFYMGNYMLDGCEAANMHTAFGYFRDAARQLRSYKDYQRPDGRIPGVIHPPKRWSVNPERWLSTQPFVGNDYPQSPVLAYALLQLHEAASSRPAVSNEQAIDPNLLLKELYGPMLRPFYMFLDEQCRVSENDPRVFLLHPHQDNRDSDPSHDRWKEDALERNWGRLGANTIRRRPRTAEHMPVWFNYLNTTMDYLGAVAINLDGYKAGWEPSRIHEHSEYIDVWYNILLYENYLAMSELAARAGETEDIAMFAELASDLGQAMDKHFFPDARDGIGGHYSIYNGQPQYNDTIGNLVVPLRRDLPTDQLRSNHALTRAAFFDSPYVLSCVALDQLDDPYHEEINRHWRTGVWIIANTTYMRGQLVQMGRSDLPEQLGESCRQLFDHTHQSNLDVVEATGDYAEHHSHLAGHGHRMQKASGHAFGTLAHYPWDKAYTSFGY